jgi:hypothetical protein
MDRNIFIDNFIIVVVVKIGCKILKLVKLVEKQAIIA